MVVQSTGGALAADGAFVLASPVSAGPFDYHLFKGGLTAGTAENWYLRSRVIDPILRPEAPAYVMAPKLFSMAGQAAVEAFGHADRDRPGIWLTTFGHQEHPDGSAVLEGTDFDLQPGMDAWVVGTQFGLELMAHADRSWDVHRAGLIADVGQLGGSAHGNAGLALAQQSGTFAATSRGIGAYYDYSSAGGFSFRALALHQWIDGKAVSNRGISGPLTSTVGTVSVVIGQKLSLSERWSLEPQAQLIMQHVDSSPFDDGYSMVANDPASTSTSKVGLHVQHEGHWQERLLRLSFGVDLLAQPDHQNTTRFDSWELSGEVGGTAARISASASYSLTEQISLSGAGHVALGMSGTSATSYGGKLGFRAEF